MDQEQKEQKESLDQLLKWTKEQMLILDMMEVKLYEMKRIGENVLEHQLSASEKDGLNRELNALKIEFGSLEKQLYPVVY